MLNKPSDAFTKTNTKSSFFGPIVLIIAEFNRI